MTGGCQRVRSACGIAAAARPGQDEFMRWLALVVMMAISVLIMWRTLSKVRHRGAQLVWWVGVLEALVLSLVSAFKADVEPDWAFFVAAVPLFGLAAASLLSPL